MVIVNHTFACGTAYKYVLPGASKAAFDKAFTEHRDHCNECHTKVLAIAGIRGKVNSFVPMEVASVETTA